MNPIDLRTLAAGRFRLGLDEAALIEPGGKKDPWYQVIPCRYGQIYPYSNTLLAVHSEGQGVRKKLAEISGLILQNWSDDGEAIFLFAPGLFDRVAEIVKPRRKRHGRQLSDGELQKFIKSGRDHRFSGESTGLKFNLAGRSGEIGAKVVQSVN